MYDKVSTNLNFVDREKKVEKFWEEITFLKRVLKTARKARPIRSMMDRQPPTANPTSVMWRPVSSKT